LTDPFIKRFRHFSELAEYAKDSDDGELLSRIAIVENYRYELPKLITSILDKASIDPFKAECLFATVHKTKGLEFKQVKLHDDFVNLTTDEQIRRPEVIEPEEINILYVAATRAKSILELNEDLETFRKLVPKPERKSL
jgi:F-box protein 18 (helicase)